MSFGTQGSQALPLRLWMVLPPDVPSQSNNQVCIDLAFQVHGNSGLYHTSYFFINSSIPKLSPVRYRVSGMLSVRLGDLDVKRDNCCKNDKTPELTSSANVEVVTLNLRISLLGLV